MFSTMPQAVTGRVFANVLKGKYHSPNGVIVISHQTADDLALVGHFAAFAGVAGLTMTTVGEVAAGATGDV